MNNKYNFDELLNICINDGEKVEYKHLKSIINIKIGEQLNKDKLFKNNENNNLFPVINGGISPSGYWNTYNFQKDLITISQGGASAGFVQYQETNFFAGVHCYVVILNHDLNKNLNYKYVYYFLKNKQEFLMQNQYGAGIPSLSKEKNLDLSIPILSLSTQNKIVEILDKFSNLINDLNDGIPKEINLREQQYRYYLNKLLSFEKGNHNE